MDPTKAGLAIITRLEIEVSGLTADHGVIGTKEETGASPSNALSLSPRPSSIPSIYWRISGLHEYYIIFGVYYAGLGDY